MPGGKKSFYGVLGLLLSIPAFASTADENRALTGPALIDAALRANAESRTLEDWRATGLQPRAALAKLLARPASEARATCRTLGALGDADLAFFEEILRIPEFQEKFRCGKALSRRVAAHWSQVRERFRDTRQRTYGTLPNFEKHIDVTVPGPVYSRGELKEGEFALTFDDGPHPSRTLRIHEILRNAGVRATFFELGTEAQAFPAISARLAAEGHTVGSHSWDHPDMTKLPLTDAEYQIDRGRTAVAEACGQAVPFFRFPYGAKTPALTALVKAKPLASFFWNMDTLDWKYRDPEVLFTHILKELDREKGGILLFHDVHEQTVIVLPRVLDELRARNASTVLFVPH